MTDRVAVIGAGQMGNGIAHVFAQAGFPVTMIDVSQEALDRGRSTIAKNIERQVKKGTIAADDQVKILARIDLSMELEDARDASLIVEAASEDSGLKFRIFTDLDRIAKPDAILATNTSSISITEIARRTSRPDKVIGMHFMNPVPVMQLVEIIRGTQTSDATYATTRGLAERMGKTTVVSKDMPGFIVNRILIPMLNEACFALQEGLASAEDIDTAMKLGTNVPMGPLTLADFIGL
ncbi:MAG: 3-hydroxyacyl-CoA dehydrogenase family protein, partial [Gemmatimonadaceae bacterium]